VPAGKVRVQDRSSGRSLYLSRPIPLHSAPLGSDLSRRRRSAKQYLKPIVGLQQSSTDTLKLFEREHNSQAVAVFGDVSFNDERVAVGVSHGNCGNGPGDARSVVSWSVQRQRQPWQLNIMVGGLCGYTPACAQ